jgi:hypothetical protein
MSIPQLSPNAVIGNPTNINPLVSATYNASAAAAGSAAMQKAVKEKSYSVTISRQALDKAAQAEGHDGEAKNTQARAATGKPKAK